MINVSNHLKQYFSLFGLFHFLSSLFIIFLLIFLFSVLLSLFSHFYYWCLILSFLFVSLILNFLCTFLYEKTGIIIKKSQFEGQSVGCMIIRGKNDKTVYIFFSSFAPEFISQLFPSSLLQPVSPMSCSLSRSCIRCPLTHSLSSLSFFSRLLFLSLPESLESLLQRVLLSEHNTHTHTPKFSLHGAGGSPKCQILQTCRLSEIPPSSWREQVNISSSYHRLGAAMLPGN